MVLVFKLSGFLKYTVTERFLLATCSPQAPQGGGTPIHPILRAATAVKMKVNSQFEILSTVNSQATISL